jgi:hypothetical protein
MKDIANQRQHTRLSANHLLRVWPVKGTKQTGETSRVVDISEGGMCFIGSRYLAPGTLVSIEIGESRLLAEIRHCRMRQYSSRIEFVTGVQIQQVLDGPDDWKSLTAASG